MKDVMTIFHDGYRTFSEDWQWRRLLTLHILAAILYATYFWEPVRALWDAFDARVFLTLNGSVAEAGAWQHTMAFANTKLYDMLCPVLMIGLMFGFTLAGYRKDLNARLAAILFIGIYMTVTAVARRDMQWMEFPRPSPSLALEPFANLRELYQEMSPKVSTGKSFPSDHGISAIIWASMMWYYAGWRVGLAAIAVTPLFILPRLYGGGHWATDVTVGSVVYSMIVLAWALCTPLGAASCRTLKRHVDKGTDWLEGLWRARQGSNLRP